MTHALSLRPRALVEIEAARDRYLLVGHGESFMDELESVFDAIQVMPRRFPAYRSIHRALLRRYPFAVFFVFARTRSTSSCSRFCPSAEIQVTGLLLDLTIKAAKHAKTAKTGDKRKAQATRA